MQWFTSNYDPGVVALSYLVSVVGAFVSLYIADYIRDTDGRIHFGWLAVASIVFGGCAVWAMHFTGMLAYRAGMPVSYDIRITLFSLVLPILFCAVGFFAAYRWPANVVAWLLSGILLGAGVATMHYVGMYGMRIEAQMIHDPFIVGVSVVIAVAAAAAALRIVVHWSGRMRALSPFIMGLAVCGMHYTGMAAMRMIPFDDPARTVDFFTGAWSPQFMGFTVGLAVFLTLLTGSALVLFRKSADVEQSAARA